MFTVALYASAIVALIVSYTKNSQKTKQALKKAYRSFTNIIPEIMTVLIIIGFALSALNPESISKLIGENSGITGLLISSGFGAITLIPPFIAFPTAMTLLENGAGIVPIAAFVSTLMMVGIVTLPLEIKYFGKKAAYVRNSLAFIFSIVIALLLGVMPWVF